MLQEHTLGKQFQTRPNAEHFLLLFAAHPLYIASHNGHQEVVRYLCEAGADKDQAEQSGYPEGKGKRNSNKGWSSGSASKGRGSKGKR